MDHRNSTLRRVGFMVGAAVLSSLAWAQSYPSKPIRILVGSTPGSVMDVVARQIADRLEAQMGQRVVVDAKASAGGIVALETLKSSPADGYTLALVPMPQMSVSPSLFTSLPYDPLKDFSMVGILFRGPQLLVVNAGLPVKSLNDLIALSKSRPEGVRYSSPATGSPSHILMEELRIQTGANLQHVAYKGPAANTAVAAGEVEALLEGIAPMMPFIQAGKVRALAVSGHHRVEAMPDVPTFEELGFRNLDAVWVGVIAPRETPAPIVELLNGQLARAVRSPELLHQYERAGRIVDVGSPREMAATIENETVRWRETIRRAGIVPN